MDRRQRKTRQAIFDAFINLLNKKDYSLITVKEIIDKADVGRATFYSHFETKDYLLKELCEELFCHIFDFTNDSVNEHKHIFECEAPSSPFLHLLYHIKNNDNNILKLLYGQNNTLFFEYFNNGVLILIESQKGIFEGRKDKSLPDDIWKNHIASVFTEIVKWWINNGLNEKADTVLEYFYKLV